MNDPIADFLTRIRNAQSAKHRYVELDWSKMRQHLTEILKERGFIEEFLVKVDDGRRGKIRIFLKYTRSRQPVIQGLRRMSSPGRRYYVGCGKIPNFYGGLGVPILSTSRGVMAGDKARAEGIGGELLCVIW